MMTRCCQRLADGLQAIESSLLYVHCSAGHGRTSGVLYMTTRCCSAGAFSPAAPMQLPRSSALLDACQQATALR